MMNGWRWPWEPLALPPYSYMLAIQAEALAARLAYEREMREDDTLTERLATIDPVCEWLTRAERNRLRFLHWLLTSGRLSEAHVREVDEDLEAREVL